MPLAALALAMAAGLTKVELPEAKLAVLLPSTPKLIQSGPNPDMPDSVEQFVWQSTGMDCVVTISYDRWRRPQFAPDKVLERYARQQLGITRYEIEPAETDSHHAAVLSAEFKPGERITTLRIRSAELSWQIDVRETGADHGVPRDILNSIDLAVNPEPENMWDEWGLAVKASHNVKDPNTNSTATNTNQANNNSGGASQNQNNQTQGNPNPTPPPVKPPLVWESRLLQDALLKFESPVKLVPVKRDLTLSARVPFKQVKEYFGTAGDVQVLVTYSVLDSGLKPDLDAWADNYRRDWEAQEATETGGKQSMLVDGAQGFKVAGFWAKEQARVVLLTSGTHCWALQIRAPMNGEGTELIERMIKSIQLNPKKA